MNMIELYVYCDFGVKFEKTEALLTPAGAARLCYPKKGAAYGKIVGRA